MSSPPFSPGDVLLSSRCPPFAHAVSAAERDSATCDGCLRRIASPRRGAGDPAACPGGCGMSAFCPPCRAAGRDLPHRRRECPLLLRAGSLRFFVDDQVRLILRVWLKIRVRRFLFCCKVSSLIYMFCGRRERTKMVKPSLGTLERQPNLQKFGASKT